MSRRFTKILVPCILTVFLVTTASSTDLQNILSITSDGSKPIYVNDSLNLNSNDLDNPNLVDGVNLDLPGNALNLSSNQYNVEPDSISTSELNTGDVDTRYLNKNGDKMNGSLNMGNNDINNIGGLQSCGSDQYVGGDGSCKNDDGGTDDQNLGYNNKNSPTGNYVKHEVTITGGSNTDIRDYYESDTTADEYGNWDWFMDGTEQKSVSSGQDAGIDSGNAISLSYNNGRDIQVGVSASGLDGSYLSSSGGELDVDAGSVLGSGNDLDNSGNVGDSDKVDGEQLTDILNDENDDVIGADWNTLTEPGIHGVSGSSWSGSNQPTSAYTYGQLIVTEGDNGIMQMYVSHHSARDGSVWIRTGWKDGSWDNWHAMPTREWVNNNDANNHDDQDISASVSGQSMDISITEGSDGSATIDDNHNLGDVLNDGDSANQDINLGTNNGILTNGGNDGNHGIAQGDGSSGYTGIDGPDIFGYAGVNIYGTNSGQKIAHFDDGGNVDIPNGNLDANGFTEGGSNTLSNNIGGSADQLDGNDASFFEEESHGGEHSGDYLSNSGDTLNVNAGSVLGSGNDLDSSGDIVSNAVGNDEIKNGNTFNMDSIHSLTDTNALVFDGGDHRITNHDGNGNFNIKAGVDDNNNIVSGDGGSHLQMSDGGAISLMTDSSSSSSFSRDAELEINNDVEVEKGPLNMRNNGINNIGGLQGCGGNQFVDGDGNCETDDSGSDDQNLGYNNKNSPTSNYKTHEITITGGSNTDIRDYYDPDTTADEYGSWDFYTDNTNRKSVSSGQDIGIDSGNAINLNWDGSRDVSVAVSASGLDGSYLSSGGGELDVAAGSVLGSGNDLDSSGDVSGLSDVDTDDLSEGGSNLYFTDERSQDAVGTIMSGSGAASVTYSDGSDSITVDADNAQTLCGGKAVLTGGNGCQSRYTSWDWYMDGAQAKAIDGDDNAGIDSGNAISLSFNDNRDIQVAVSASGLDGSYLSSGGGELDVAAGSVLGSGNDLDSSGDVSGLTDVTTSDLSEGSNEYHTDGRVHGAVESGNVDNVQFSNIESVSNGEIGRDNSIGFLAEWGGNGNAVLWDAYNVQTNGGISVTGGTGNEDNPKINLAANDLDASGNINDWSGADDLDGSGDVNSGAAGSYLSESGGSLDVNVGSVLGSGNDLDSSGNVNHGIGASLGDGRDAGSDYVTFANSGDFYIGGSSTPDASTSGIHVEANSNPSSGNPIFTVESSGGSERLRVEHGGDLYTSNNLDVDGGNIYDSGSNFFGGCSSGDYVESINSDGSVNCANDDTGGTSLTGGDGIDPSSISNGNTLSAAWGDANDLDSSGNVNPSSLDGIGLDSNSTHLEFGGFTTIVSGGAVANFVTDTAAINYWGSDSMEASTISNYNLHGKTYSAATPSVRWNAADDLDASGNLDDFGDANDLDSNGDLNNVGWSDFDNAAQSDVDYSDIPLSNHAGDQITWDSNNNEYDTNLNDLVAGSHLSGSNYDGSGSVTFDVSDDWIDEGSDDVGEGLSWVSPSNEIKVSWQDAEGLNQNGYINTGNGLSNNQGGSVDVDWTDANDLDSNGNVNWGNADDLDSSGDLNAYNFANQGSAPQNEIITGDANGDGWINKEDIQIIQNEAVGLTPDCGSNRIARCDINGDGSVQTNDIQLLARFLNGDEDHSSTQIPVEGHMIRDSNSEVSVDLGSKPQQIGNTGNSGVIQTDSTMTYNDKGDSVELGVSSVDTGQIDSQAVTSSETTVFSRNTADEDVFHRKTADLNSGNTDDVSDTITAPEDPGSGNEAVVRVTWSIGRYCKWFLGTFGNVYTVESAGGTCGTSQGSKDTNLYRSGTSFKLENNFGTDNRYMLTAYN